MKNKFFNCVLIFLLLLSGLLGQQGAVKAKTTKNNSIIAFERVNPVYTETAELGTEVTKLKLPKTLRAIQPLSTSALDGKGFVQAKPTVDMSDGYESYDYYQFGYIAPDDVDHLYKTGEKAIYALHYNDPNKATLGEIAYRVYGSIGNVTSWFSCDVKGNIDGIVKEIPIVWNDGDYQMFEEGTYVFETVLKEYTYQGELPFAKIKVKASEEESGKEKNKSEARDDQSKTETKSEVKDDQTSSNVITAPKQEALKRVAINDTCHCFGEAIIDANENFPWAHKTGCPYFSPVECMCKTMNEFDNEYRDENGTLHKQTITMPGDFSHVHDPNNKDCPLYSKDTIRIKKLALDEESVMSKEDALKITEAQAKGTLLYKTLGSIETIKGSEQKAPASSKARSSQPKGINNDANLKELITKYTPTSGNSDYVSDSTEGLTIPGSWVDYVNTIWMNKANTKFAWTSTADTQSYNGWQWGGVSAFMNIDTPQTNAYCYPIRANGIWNIYSGEQLRYALINCTSNDTISIQGNLDMGGFYHNWETVLMANKNITIQGNGYKIYNLSVCVSDTSQSNQDISGFISQFFNLNVSDLDFVSAKFASVQHRVGLFEGAWGQWGYTASAVLKNVNVEDSMFYSISTVMGIVSPLGTLVSDESNTETFTSTDISYCRTKGNYLYGSDHISGFTLGLGNYHSNAPLSRVVSSYSVDNLICGTGGHSAGFSSCAGGHVDMANCFTANEIYGSALVSGFIGFFDKSFSGCYSTGKLEGYARLAGFAWDLDPVERTFNNCYSTVLVGLRKTGTELGGFVVGVNKNTGSKNTMIDCYAAGEVGNYDTDMNAPKATGGFTTTSSVAKNYSMTNCYYDKQTTAMREWVTGDSKSEVGVTGVLTTSDYADHTGLASGAYGGSGNTGFKGFSNDREWIFSEGHYPQLRFFADAPSFKDASTVIAYSRASTATVSLNTWSKGYDWDDTGVRSSTQIGYNRTLSSTGKSDHKGNQYTYDTVREIVTEAKTTSGSDWSHMIPGGAKISINGTQSSTNAMEVTNNKLQIKAPGMDWFKISETVNGSVGYRPIRLISYMNIEAGKDTTITSGSKYDHRSDVEMTMMDKITDNLVVGLDDNDVWSTAKKGGYPSSSKFYAVPTTNMETDFSASKDAWVNTEIWRAKQDTDLNYVSDTTNGVGSEKLVPDVSVKVTGSGTGNGLTLTEQKWNGEQAQYLDVSKSRKYIITYYWMLKDGRYITDSKIVTLKPGVSKSSMYVKDEATDLSNSTSLYLGAGMDKGTGSAYTFPSYTASSKTLSSIPYTQDVALALKKKNSAVEIAKSKLTLTANDGTVMGSIERSGDIIAGDIFKIPIKYYYLTYEYDDQLKANREVTAEETVEVSYTVEKDTSGGLYLKFNKLINPPSDEVASALTGTSEGIPSGTKAYINDTLYNIDLTVWVKKSMDFEFTKVNEKGSFMKGVEFQVYRCKKNHTSTSQHSTIAEDVVGNCWDMEAPAYDVTTGTDGKVKLSGIASGEYILKEVKTNAGYQLPTGQWLITVDADKNTSKIETRGTNGIAFKVTQTTVSGVTKDSYQLTNYPKTDLPYVGGDGSTGYAKCGLLFIGLGVLLYADKRRKAYCWRKVK